MRIVYELIVFLNCYNISVCVTNAEDCLDAFLEYQ